MSQTTTHLRSYTYYVAGSACYGWAPLFFLYMSARCSVRQVLLLEALYYICVVLLEVPSGYLSDRLGRKPTLMTAALCLTISYVTFAASDSWQGLACAQIFLAMGISFNSGTDTSYHLARLRAEGLEDEYGEREAKLGQLALGVSASAALAGGALGVFDMRLAYALSAAGALLALGAATRFEEPVRADRERESLRANIGRVLRLVGTRELRWLFAFASVATLVNHIPYEFYQPYIGNLEFEQWQWLGTQSEAPTLVTGIHLMVVQLTASWWAGRSVAWAQRVGVRRFLLGSMGLQVALIASMSQFTHPLVVVALVARAWPGAAQRAPIRAHVTPHLPESVSATYLSVQSLAGRLGFALTLLVLSQIGGEEHAADLGSVLLAALLIAGVCFGLLVLTAVFNSPRRVRPHDT